VPAVTPLAGVALAVVGLAQGVGAGLGAAVYFVELFVFDLVDAVP
jgi:hypothetical protein